MFDERCGVMSGDVWKERCCQRREIGDICSYPSGANGVAADHIRLMILAPKHGSFALAHTSLIGMVEPSANLHRSSSGGTQQNVPVNLAQRSGTSPNSFLTRHTFWPRSKVLGRRDDKGRHRQDASQDGGAAMNIGLSATFSTRMREPTRTSPKLEGRSR